MGAERNLTLRVMDAICASDLPPDLRHALMVMAFRADSQTGVGTHSQRTLAGALGCSERDFRRRLEDIDAAASSAGLPIRVRGRRGETWQPAVVHSPIRIERRHRGREGVAFGRDSDEWRLVLSNRTTSAGSTPNETDNVCRLERVQPDNVCRLNDSGPTGQERGSNRTRTGVQPDNVCRQSSDLRIFGSERAPQPKSAASRKKAKATKPEQPSDPRLHPLRDSYVEAYKAANGGAAPALDRRGWGRAMKAFADLLEATKSEDRARLCIERTFGSEDNFIRTKRCQPWEIAADANKLLAATPAKGRLVQRGGFDVENAGRASWADEPETSKIAAGGRA